MLIVGGGVAGLSAAWRLRGAGLGDFALLELDPVLGGTARHGQNAVSAYPWGAHYLPAPLSAAGPVPRLLTELGVMTGVDERGRPQMAEEAMVAEPDERLYFKGSWYDGLYLRAGASRDDLQQLARFEAEMASFAAAKDGKGRRAFDVPVARGSDDAEWAQLDKLSMAQWLASRGFTSPRLLWLVDYGCRDDFGATAADVSAWAGIWYFAARHEGDASASFLTWPEGNGALVKQLSAGLPASATHTGTLVHGLERINERWVAHAIGPNGAPVAVGARQVVLACPRFIAVRLLDEWRERPPEFARAFRYGPWAVANVTLAELPQGRGAPIAWDNVLYESKSLGYVVATHQRPRARAVGPTVVTWYYPLTGSNERAERERLLGTSYADWERVVMADLSLPHAVKAERIELMRWGHAMVRPAVGFMWGGARQAAQASLHDSLHFAHSDLGGMALFEEANHFGVLAAERALAALGRPSMSWL